MICGILNIRLRKQELEVGHPLEVLKSKWMFKTKVLENQINSSLSVEMCGVGFFFYSYLNGAQLAHQILAHFRNMPSEPTP